MGHILQPVKYSGKADANLYSPTFELLQGNKIKSDYKNNIVVQCSKGNIILDCHVKTCDDWVARVKFLQENCHKRAQLANAVTKENLNDLYAKLGRPSEVITHVTDKSMGIHLICKSV